MQSDPRDWYWLAEDGRLFASGRAAIVPEADAAYVAWCEAGGVATRWPEDDAGHQTDAALQDVLAPYGLSMPGYEAVPISVTSAQAKIALLRTPGVAGGKTLLDDVKAAVAADKKGEVAIWFSDARTWDRANPYVGSLASGLGLKAADVDALFVTAAKIAA